MMPLLDTLADRIGALVRDAPASPGPEPGFAAVLDAEVAGTGRQPEAETPTLETAGDDPTDSTTAALLAAGGASPMPATAIPVTPTPSTGGDAEVPEVQLAPEADTSGAPELTQDRTASAETLPLPDPASIAEAPASAEASDVGSPTAPPAEPSLSDVPDEASLPVAPTPEASSDATALPVEIADDAASSPDTPPATADASTGDEAAPKTDDAPRASASAEHSPVQSDQPPFDAQADTSGHDTPQDDSAPPPADAEPSAPTDAAPSEPLADVTGASSTSAPSAVQTTALAVEIDADAPDPTADATTDAALEGLTGLGAASTPGESRPVAAPMAMPARLAVPAWVGAAVAAGDRAIQVALGDDGTVRLQTEREADGVTVHLRFSDPDLQALAGAHAVRLREVLEAHFAEPVRLALGDASADASGADAGQTGADARPGDRGPSGSAPSGPSPSDRPAPRPSASGRREWIG